MTARIMTILLLVVIFGAAQAQKGSFSIAAGPFIAVLANLGGYTYLKSGAGIIIIGQYSLSDKSALLLQPGIAIYGTKPSLYYTGNAIFISTLYGGYKYSFGNSGYFINGLAGFGSYSVHNLSSTDFLLGVGKRFIIKELYFINAGVDYVFGDTDSRFNIKAVFSLLRRPETK